MQSGATMIVKRTVLIPLLIWLNILALICCRAPTVVGPTIDVNETPTPQLDHGLISIADDHLDAFEAALEQIYTQVNPSVVMIKATLPPSAISNEWDLPGLPFRPGLQDQVGKSQIIVGSGFVWDMSGHVVTN